MVADALEQGEGLGEERLSGQVGRLALKSLRVLPQGVVALTQAQGDLEARVELGK